MKTIDLCSLYRLKRCDLCKLMSTSPGRLSAFEIQTFLS